MKKILLFARDPGGANVIIPFIKPLLGKYILHVYGKDAGYRKLNEEYAQTFNITESISCISIESITCWLELLRPDFVITGTSADDMAEKYIWKACERIGIPAFAILDQWVNYGVRFSAYGVSELSEYEKEKIHCYQPFKIIVMDEYAKCEMIRAGFEENRILAAGQPHFDRIKSIFDGLKAVISQELELVFVSEPIEKVYKETTEGSHYWGYTEKTIFLQVQKVLMDLAKKYNKNVHLVVRPHPKENEDSYYKEILQTENYHVTIDEKTEGLQLIKNADYIIGMSSMLLLEAAVCGRPIISVQIGLARENPLILARKGLMETVTQKEQLWHTMEKIFSGGITPAAMDVPKGASKKIIKYMEAYLWASWQSMEEKKSGQGSFRLIG